MGKHISRKYLPVCLDVVELNMVLVKVVLVDVLVITLLSVVVFGITSSLESLLFKPKKH